MKPLRSCVRHYQNVHARFARARRQQNASGTERIKVRELLLKRPGSFEAFCREHMVRLEVLERSLSYSSDRLTCCLYCPRCEHDKRVALWRPVAP